MTEYGLGDVFAADRLEKLRELRDRNIKIYPHEFERTATLRELERQYDEADESTGEDVHRISGRVSTIGRTDEGDLFVDITDGYRTVRVMPPDSSQDDHETHRLVNTCDLIGVTGAVARVEPNIIIFVSSDITILSKTLCRPPDRQSDQEGHPDPIAALWDESVTSAVNSRYALMRELRSYLTEQGFVEVETPFLRNPSDDIDSPGFETRLDATDERITFRCSKSDSHRRLIAGGFERLFEIGADFRRTATHSVVTSVELHHAYADCEDMMALTERMVSEVLATLTNGNFTVTFDGREINFDRPWTHLTVADAIEEYAAIDAPSHRNGGLGDQAQRGGSAPIEGSPPEPDTETAVEGIRSQLTDATFLSGYPSDTAPGRNPRDADDTDCVGLIAGGEELAVLFTVPHNPIEVARRSDDSSAPQDGDGQARSSADKDLLRSLVYGMPPTAGVRLNVDRLSMLITDSNSVGATFPFYRYESTS